MMATAYGDIQLRGSQAKFHHQIAAHDSESLSHFITQMYNTTEKGLKREQPYHHQNQSPVLVSGSALVEKYQQRQEKNAQ